MRTINLRSLLAHGIVLVSLAACGGAGPTLPADPGWTAALDELKTTVAASTGYAASAIELLASPAHVRVSISDDRLALADQATRESTATAVVAALEKSMAANARFASVVEVSVAILHAPEGSAHGSHVEDVVDFRKGPDQRFALHIT